MPPPKNNVRLKNQTHDLKVTSAQRVQSRGMQKETKEKEEGREEGGGMASECPWGLSYSPQQHHLTPTA
jgi:hypothetical protein